MVVYTTTCFFFLLGDLTGAIRLHNKNNLFILIFPHRNITTIFFLYKKIVI